MSSVALEKEVEANEKVIWLTILSSERYLQRLKRFLLNDKC